MSIMNLELVDITFSYSKSEPVLKQVSHRFELGECVGIIGKNGAGKTTLLHLLSGIFPPQSGHVIVSGQDINRYPQYKNHIGFSPENPPLYPDMTVYSFLRTVAEFRLMSESQSRTAINTVVAQFELESVLKKPLKHLSKGFKQRVGLAQAVLHNPTIILLDEPTSGLDPDQQHHFFSWLAAVKSNHIILFSSHHISDLEAQCSTILKLENGSLTPWTI